MSDDDLETYSAAPLPQMPYAYSAPNGSFAYSNPPAELPGINGGAPREPWGLRMPDRRGYNMLAPSGPTWRDRIGKQRPADMSIDPKAEGGNWTDTDDYMGDPTRIPPPRTMRET